MKIDLHTKYNNLTENEIIKICQDNDHPENEFAKTYLYAKYKPSLKKYVYSTIRKGGQGGGHKIQKEYSKALQDELYSSATCAFMHALRKYDTEKKDKAAFKSYLTFWMRDYIQKEIRNMNGLIKIDNRVWRKFLKYCSDNTETINMLTTAKDADLNKVAKSIGCEPAELIDVIQTAYMNKVTTVSNPDTQKQTDVFEVLPCEKQDNKYKNMWIDMEKVVYDAAKLSLSNSDINNKVKEYLASNGNVDESKINTLFLSKTYSDMVENIKKSLSE